MTNLAALRAAVFPLSAKNLTGGLKSTPPPVRGLNYARENNVNARKKLIQMIQEKI